MSALVFRILRYAGAGYLLYLAYSMWRSVGSFQVENLNRDIRFFRIVGRAVLLNLLNPKLTLFFLAFLPQFIPASSANPLGSLVRLCSVFMLMTLVVFMGYGFLAASVRHIIEKSSNAMKWIQRSFAVILALFSLRLILSDE